MLVEEDDSEGLVADAEVAPSAEEAVDSEEDLKNETPLSQLRLTHT